AEQLIVVLDVDLTLTREEEDRRHCERRLNRRHRKAVGPLNTTPHPARRAKRRRALGRRHYVRFEVADDGLARLIGKGRSGRESKNDSHCSKTLLHHLPPVHLMAATICA